MQGPAFVMPEIPAQSILHRCFGFDGSTGFSVQRKFRLWHKKAASPSETRPFEKSDATPCVAGFQLSAATSSSSATAAGESTHSIKAMGAESDFR
jgi:hypothetical protein